VYLNRLEVLAATYERHLDTVVNSVPVVNLKFESCDRQRMQDMMADRLWVRMPFVSCVTCDGAAAVMVKRRRPRLKLGVARRRRG